MAFTQGQPATVSSTSLDTNHSGTIEVQMDYHDHLIINQASQESETEGLQIENVSFPSMDYVTTTVTAHVDQVPSTASLVARPNQQHITATTQVVVPAMPSSNSVPEFLYQLTKMLNDNNRDTIEWSNGKWD
jgi:hypothetical protein